MLGKTGIFCTPTNSQKGADATTICSDRMGDTPSHDKRSDIVDEDSFATFKMEYDINSEDATKSDNQHLVVFGLNFVTRRAIMTYLVNKYSPNNSLYPKDPKKRALVDMMLNFDQGTLYRSQVEYLYPVIFRQESPDSTRELSYRHSLAILDRSLERSAYVAGKHLTLADLSIVASISLAEAYDYNFRPYTNIVEWLRRLKSELLYYREVNEIPLLQFKFWYRPVVDIDGEETTPFEISTGKTKL